MTLRPVSFVASLMLLSLLAAACRPQPAVPSGGPGARATKKIVYATIVITSRPSTNSCVATTIPGRVQVAKNEDIEWSVVDFCGATDGYTKDVELKNWSVVTGPDCGGSPIPVDPSATGKQHIRRGIKGSCSSGSVFKYEIWVETTRLADPELEIAS